MKKMTSVIIVACLIGLALTGCIDDNGNTDYKTVYISILGDDSNDGTKTSPWQTLSKISEVSENTTVMIAEGTYTPTERVFINSDKVKIIGNSATIDGSLCPDWWSGTIQFEDKSNIEIRGLEIINSQYFAIFMVGSCHNILIEDCVMHNIQGGGIVLYNKGETPTNVKVTGCTLDTFGMNGNQEGISLQGVNGFAITSNTVTNGFKEGIDVKSGCRNGVIANNYVADMADHRPCIYVDAYARTQWDIEVIENTCMGTGQGIGLATEQGGKLANILVQHNYVNVKSNAFSIHRYNTEGSHLKTNITIKDNTFISDEAGSIQITEYPERFVDCIAKNNVLSGVFIQCPICE